MHFKLIAAAVLVTALLAPKTACADVIDDFTIVGNGVDITFSLPATSHVLVTTPHSYWNQTFPDIRNGVPGTSSLLIPVAFGGPCGYEEEANLAAVTLCEFYEPFTAGGMWSLANFVAAPGFSNGYVDFTWNPGTYLDTDLLDPIKPCPYFGYYPCSFPQYTITITPEATQVGATPEPGTLALLSTGLAGGWSILRRRRAR